MKIAEDEIKKIKKNRSPSDYTQQPRYLLLSVRHFLVCRVDVTGKFSYTAPTSLMDGLKLPSPSTVNLLLQALSPSRPLAHTPIHALLLEIQNRILRHVSEGPIKAARLGCVLGLGSAFNWKRELMGRGDVVLLSFSPLIRIGMNAHLLSRRFVLEMCSVEYRIAEYADDLTAIWYRLLLKITDI